MAQVAEEIQFSIGYETKFLTLLNLVSVLELNFSPSTNKLDKKQKGTHLSKKGFSVLLAKAEQPNRFVSIRIRYKHELVVGVANSVNGCAS